MAMCFFFEMGIYFKIFQPLHRSMYVAIHYYNPSNRNHNKMNLTLPILKSITKNYPILTKTFMMVFLNTRHPPIFGDGLPPFTTTPRNVSPNPLDAKDISDGESNVTSVQIRASFGGTEADDHKSGASCIRRRLAVCQAGKRATVHCAACMHGHMRGYRHVGSA